MSSAFEVLGLAESADQQQVRAAYRQRVKLCHPDIFQEESRKNAAQEQLIKLNLAYEEALRLSSQRQVGYQTVSSAQAKSFARRLMEQGRYESALRQLCRAEGKDDEWFYIQGQILMSLKQYDSAHQSFREAVRRCPDSLPYRRAALDAAVTLKKHQRFPYRIVDFAEGILKPRKGNQ